MTQYTKSLHILQITFTVFYLKYSEVFIRWELKQKASLNKGCPAPVKTSERDALLTANPTQAAALEHQMSTIYFLYAFPHYIKRKPRDNPAHIQPQRAVTILWNAFLITPITKALCNLIRNQHDLSSAKAFCIYMWGWIFYKFCIIFLNWKPV